MHFTVDTYLAITGIMLGVVAVAMAFPTFIQMIWGAPDLRIEFEANDLERGARQLRCYISNDIIRSRFLRKLGVYRLPVEISADYTVYESGTNMLIANFRHPYITTDKENGLQVSLTATFAPARFIVVAHIDGKAFVPKYGDEIDHVEILQGKYYIDLSIMTSSNVNYSRKPEFIVGGKPMQTFWLPYPPV